MAQLIFKNNAQSTLAGSIGNTATSLQLAAGTGILFPQPTAGQYFVGTMIDAATGLINEIVWCTQVSGDTVTIVRGQENTTPKPWNANDAFAELWTAGQAGQMLQQGQNQSQASNYAVDVGTTNAIRCVLNPPISSPVVGMPIRVLISNNNTGATTLDPGSGAAPVVLGNGNALTPNTCIAGMISEFIWTSSRYELVAPSNQAVFAPGTVAAFAGGTAPAGWLFCDGSVQVRANFPDLFNAIGTAYNTSGETALQFRLPDLRGRVIAMADGGTGRLTTATITAPNSQGGYGGQETEGASVSVSGSVSGSTSGAQYLDTNLPTDQGTQTQYGGIVGSGDVAHGYHTHYSHIYGWTQGQALSVSASGSMSGSTSTVSNVQPSLIMFYMIKI